MTKISFSFCFDNIVTHEARSGGSPDHGIFMSKKAQQPCPSNRFADFRKGQTAFSSVDVRPTPHADKFCIPLHQGHKDRVHTLAASQSHRWLYNIPAVSVGPGCLPRGLLADSRLCRLRSGVPEHPGAVRLVQAGTVRVVRIPE